MALDDSSGYETTDYDSEEELEETFAERVYGLRDVVPPLTRMRIKTKVTDFAESVKKVAVWLGKGAWILATSSIVMLLPVIYESERDLHYAMLENEQKQREISAQVLFEK